MPHAPRYRIARLEVYPVSSSDPFAEINPVPVDEERLATFNKEWDFMALAVDLLGEVTAYTATASCVMGVTPQWNRDQAAIGGNMVRLTKLLSAFLDQTCQKRGESSLILARLVFETVVTIKFLIQNYSRSLIDSYIQHSLRHERRLWDVIEKNVSERGASLAIEDRMRKSISRAASIAGIDLDKVDPRSGGNWGNKNIFEKAKAVGLESAYLAAFSGMSHNVHGSWHDIYSNHLEYDEATGGFTPNLDWTRPRPQICHVLGIVAIEAASEFIGFIAGDKALAGVSERLDDLNLRIHKADTAHELYLSKKNWPEI